MLYRVYDGNSMRVQLLYAIYINPVETLSICKSCLSLTEWDENFELFWSF